MSGDHTRDSRIAQLSYEGIAGEMLGEGERTAWATLLEDGRIDIKGICKPAWER